LQLPVGAPPEQPSPKSIDVFRDCRGYKPADKEPKYPWNYVAEWPAYSLLHIHHPQPDAYANRCLQKDHSIDTHYRSLVPDPGRRSMSAKPSCRKEKEGPARMHATRAVKPTANSIERWSYAATHPLGLSRAVSKVNSPGTKVGEST
jgi:hypothetical protein